MKESSINIDWSTTYNECFPAVKKMCGSILGYNHNYIDDCISETFEKGIMKEHTYKKELSSVKTWLCNISKNVCFHRLKEDKSTGPILIEFEHKNDEPEISYNNIWCLLSSMPDSINKETFIAHLDGKNY